MIDKIDTQIQEAIDMFYTPWSRLVDFLNDGEMIRIFKSRGLEINYTLIQSKGKNLNFDMIAHLENEIIVVDVKTRLNVKDIDIFRNKLAKINDTIQIYRNSKVYGSVAYLKADEQSDTYAGSKGLWVIRATGNSVSIINQNNFKPKIY